MFYNARGIWIQIQLEHMTMYLEVVQEALSKKQAELDAYFEEVTKDMSPDDREAFVDHLADDHWVANTVMPGHLYSSFIVSWHSFVERQLYTVANQLQKERGLRLGQADLKGQGVERSRLYLDKVVRLPLVDDQWKELSHIRSIRNTAVHNGGIFKEVPGNLRPYLTTHNLLSKDGIDQLTPTLEFCRHLVRFAGEFFRIIFYDAGWTAGRNSFKAKRPG